MHAHAASVSDSVHDVEVVCPFWCTMEHCWPVCSFWCTLKHCRPKFLLPNCSGRPTGLLDRSVKSVHQTRSALVEPLRHLSFALQTLRSQRVVLQILPSVSAKKEVAVQVSKMHLIQHATCSDGVEGKHASNCINNLPHCNGFLVNECLKCNQRFLGAGKPHVGKTHLGKTSGSKQFY